jgi:alanine dehydrogenase
VPISVEASEPTAAKSSGVLMPPAPSVRAHRVSVLPFVLKIAKLGAEEAMRRDPHLANGLTVSGGKVRHQAVAEALDLEFEPA